nr:hypothetical protein [Tanacetum cinerariifolium]
MADVNVNALADQAPTMAPPTRTDNQILPHIRWVPIGKSNCYLDVEKSQSNPIYKIAVDILKHTNFFKAFTASSTIPSIYIQQFWDTVLYDKTAGCYKCQLDEQGLDLTKDTLRDALQITPVNNNKAFSSPQSSYALINFVNELGYSKLVRNLSNVEYLEKVATHQIYLSGEQGSDPDSPTPKPTKATKKSKPSAPKADLGPPVSKSASSQQPEPKHAPVTSQGKKRKLVMKISDKLSLARKSRPGLVSKRSKPISSLRRRTSTPTGSSGHDESSSLYAELGLTDSEVESDEDVPRMDVGVQGEGRAGPNLGDVAATQPLPSPVVHAGPNLKHMDLEVTNVSTQPHPEQIDEGFTATAYSKVHENLKLTVEEQVILEEPASSTGTLSSLQHLTKDLSFGDLFFNDKPSEADNENATTETEADSMMSVRKAVDEVVTDAVDWAIQPPLRNRFRDLPEADMKEYMNRDHSEELLKDLVEARKKKKRRRDSPKTPPGSPPPPQPPTCPSGASGSPEASGSSLVSPPPPPPPSTNQEGQSQGSTASSSSKTAASAEYQAWTTTNTSLRPSVSLTPADLQMDDDMAPDAQAQSSDDEDIGNAHIPKASALASTYSPSPEDSLLAQTSDIAMFMDWFCKRQGITELKHQDLEGPTFELVKVFHPNVIHLQYQMEECHKLLTDSVDDSIPRHNVSKPLPLGGRPGQVTIQSDFFFKKDLEYLRYGSKGSRPALSILKIKAAYYPDVGLEQMVPDQMWIEEECKYDIAAMYGISHWWFQRQRFYINKHTSEGNHRAVRTRMRILSVVRIKVFSMYGYDYMTKIVLRRADLNEHIITERDFKYLYPSDFEDLYLLNLQGHRNHLPPKDKKILTTAINLWTRHLVIRQRVEDFQLRMIMRFNEIYKFSDNTLHQIDEALDYRVKEFKVNRMNLGLNTRFWTRKDVDRSKEFMFAIQKRLKTMRIFCNLKSFVGGRVRVGDYRLLKRTK